MDQQTQSKAENNPPCYQQQICSAGFESEVFSKDLGAEPGINYSGGGVKLFTQSIPKSGSLALNQKKKQHYLIC